MIKQGEGGAKRPGNATKGGAGGVGGLGGGVRPRGRMSDERPTDEGRRKRSGWREGGQRRRDGRRAERGEGGRRGGEGKEEKRRSQKRRDLPGRQEVELANREPTGVICSFSHRIGQQRRGVSQRRPSDAS